MSKECLRFTKMHGCGNDYIYINCFKERLLELDGDELKDLIVRLSDRRFGIGGDGVILICPSEVADARMRMFNLDGSEGNMCGNGIRCVAKYVYDYGIAKKPGLTIETKSGIKTIELKIENDVAVMATVDMGRAELDPAKIPVKLAGGPVISRKVQIAGGEFEITCVSMGNPHCVLFREDIDVTELGPKFEHDQLFPESVNTEFVRVIDSETLQMRVWERGSGETWACGTGACATAVAAVENGFCKKGADITVKLRGGDLIINYTDQRVMMTGPATTVFEGVIEL